ncbi:MAG: hypothetical protein KDK01_04070 [Rhodobacteraceae bacterium]|jgi:flagellar motility protein MotE (MotC chaperone)|nr:hypothetical protein [Paracoccaceae bacterium]
MAIIPRAVRKPRARVLPVLITFFMLGATLRVITGLDAALAQGPDETAHVATAALQPAAADPLPATADSIAFSSTQEAAQILVDIRQRERRLQDHETSLNEREVLIAAAQARLQEQVDALTAAERELAATMALADRAAEEDLGRLVSVFQAMGSEEAAAVFSEMAPEFAAGFLARLAPESAAAILSGLEPRQAYALSAILAGRNALVPRD